MHCPQCGKAIPEGAVVCPACGASLAPFGAPAPTGRAKPMARTLVGVAVTDMVRSVPQAGAPAIPSTPAQDPAANVAPGRAGLPFAGSKTIVGMPASQLGVAPPQGDPRLFGATLVVGTPASAPSDLGRDATLLGQPAPLQPGAPAPPGPTQPPAASRTLLGVARPGIAPLAPGVAAPDLPEPDLSSDYQPVAELGATMAPAPSVRLPDDRKRALMRQQRLPPLKRKASERVRVSRRGIIVVIAGAVLAAFAVLFAVLWPSAPPVTARARADAGGRELIELRCESCPDGTAVSVGEARASMAGGVAQIPIATPLSVGENQVKVAIDRPGGGRDETVGVSINVAYRIRPDLGTLQGERPSIQIVVEASKGTRVTLDGRDVALVSGRAIQAIDVSDAITGASEEGATLSRQVPYQVTPPDGPRETGVVSVSVGIVPLHIEAPGASVVTDKESFVLAGRTARGAQLFAGAHPISVRPDGTFAHVMNVSSVGATQFEVRAKMQGMAPRIAKIAVRRVDRIETAAREFVAQGFVGYAELAALGKDHIGKPIVLSGEILEARRQSYSTVMLLSVAQSAGCKERAPSSLDACKVRLVHGAENPARRGDQLTAYGRIAPPFVAPDGAQIPEVQVEFTTRGPAPADVRPTLKAAAGAEPRPSAASGASNRLAAPPAPNPNPSEAP